MATRPSRPGSKPAPKASARPAKAGAKPGPKPGPAASRPAGRGPAKPRPAAEKPAPRPAQLRAAERAAKAKATRQHEANAAAKRPAAPKAKATGSGERLQKLLAHAGIASRRAAEELILEGRVHVNGQVVTTLGTKADPSRDTITVDHRPLEFEAPVYILMNKPKGYITSVKDEEGRPTVMALLHGVSERVYPVGRLDFQSEGLLLLTNDGALAQRFTSPDHEIPKVYLVKVHRLPKPETLQELRDGFLLSGRRLKPCGIEVLEKSGNPWLRVTLTEGKNQQIRKMFAAVGHPVHKLRRIQFGPLADERIKPGEWRFLSPQEIAAVRSL